MVYMFYVSWKILLKQSNDHGKKIFTFCHDLSTIHHNRVIDLELQTIVYICLKISV